MADSTSEHISNNEENSNPNKDENLIPDSVIDNEITDSKIIDNDLVDASPGILEDIIIDNCNDYELYKRRSSDDMEMVEPVNHSKRLKIDSQSSSPSPDSKPACATLDSGLTSPVILPQETLTTLHDDFAGSGKIEFYLPIELLTHQPISRIVSRDIRITSEVLTLRELPWRILVVKKCMDRNLGVFVQCDPACKNEYPQWSCQAHANLSLVNTVDRSTSVIRDLYYEFTTRTNDWGYASMIEINSTFLDEKVGWVTDGRILLETIIVADAPHSMGWDSKTHSGFVGLRNQGATCYMNSMLQSLFFTNVLRRAVYQMPTQGHDTNLSVALALQRLFYELQHSDKAVSTKKLTRAFGWKTLDILMQHDVQEMCRVLLDNLDAAMKNTCVDGTIPGYLEGKMESYIKCTGVDYMSSREETFFDIQLNVKGLSHISDSFRDYIAPEILDGDNKYDAGDHGLQKAEKGVFFLRFPPVLHLHLMRFQFDPQTNLNDKINDRCEFPDRLDLTEFLKDPPTKPVIYLLHTIFVHTGDNNGGHYVTYLNPNCDENWFKFDDEIVFRCSKEEAIENNFGGQSEHHNNRFCTNAYMLVYICEDDMEDIIRTVTEEDIPQYLHQRIEDERQSEALKRKERQEAHLYMRVDVYTDKQFEQNHGFDLVTDYVEQQLTLNVKKDTVFTSFHNDIASHFGCAPDRCRIWPIKSRINESYRPTSQHSALSGEATIWAHSEQTNNWRIFLEIVEDKENGTLPQFDVKSDVIFFLKFFDVYDQTISYIGSQIFSINASFTEFSPLLCKLAGLPEDCELDFFEEVAYGQIVPLDRDGSVSSINELADGDVLLYQLAHYDATRITTLPFRNPMLNAKDYLDDISLRICIAFKQVGVDDYGFAMHLRRDMCYPEMAVMMGKILNMDYQKIQFFRSAYYMDVISDDIKHDCTSYLAQLVSPRYHKNEDYTLLYRFLDIRLAELANKMPIKCNLLSPNATVENTCQLYVDKTEFCANIFDRCRIQFNLDPEPIRAYHVSSARISQVFTEKDSLVSNLRPPALNIDMVPPDQVNINGFQVLVQVVHFNKTIANCFGIPFLILLNDGDTVQLIRKKIQLRLNLTESVFKRYKLAIIRDLAITHQEDESIVFEVDDFKKTQVPVHLLTNCFSRKWNSVFFGLDHVDKPKNKSYYTEKAIKIHN
ncbi:Ubiquitin carboxyl-terminal hydrolase 7 isoform X1 [Oopsacas minuta]|uniref:Ubiquitin carboxyl-terminal hydrolase 7 n=1 Tax=Oopsacas minuta TaxID=111878 RepID=A0AAV7JTK2_9METZ|nr:Ubiquitin carboxyl-terminal hydrolase 7 isoform X1 [Oopsacas minuta]